MTFTNAVSDGLNKFFSPRGRTSRSGFWWYFLFSLILFFVLYVCIDMIFEESTAGWIIANLASLLFNITITIAMIRRLHDIGKSGWNIFWSVIPLVGTIYVIVLLCKPSEPEDNYWGPVPQS